MDFFNDLGKTLNDMAAMAADKVGEFAENAKLKATIASEKREVSQKYEAIGRRIYEMRKENLSPASTDTIDRFCLEIEEKEAKIRELQERLKEAEKDMEKDNDTPDDDAEIVDAEVIEEDDTVK